MDIRRFGRPHRDTEWVRTRTLEAYRSTTRWHGRHEEHESGRPCRTIAVVSRGCSTPVRVSVRSSDGSDRTGSPTRRPAKPRTTYTPMNARTGSMRLVESIGACRETAGLFDQTSFAKFVLKGPDALSGAQLDLCEQRRQASRFADLHPDARRPRRHPMRPDRVPGRCRTSSTSSPVPASPPTTSTGSSANILRGYKCPAVRHHVVQQRCCRCSVPTLEAYLAAGARAPS